MKKKMVRASVYFILISFCMSCVDGKTDISFSQTNNQYSFESSHIKIELDKKMRFKTYKKSEDKLLGFIGEGQAPHYIIINDTEVKDFLIDESKTEQIKLENNYGKGKRLILKGIADGPKNSKVEKKISIDIYEDFPNAAQISITYKNISSTPGLFIEKEVNNSFTLDASLINEEYNKHAFWILQGGSYHERPDWILPVTEDFAFENYQGAQFDSSESGGGLPVLDVWCKETGFFIGSLRDKPTTISLPAKINKEGFLEISIEYKRNKIPFDNSYESIPLIVGVHDGDYYNGLRTYTNIMARNGFEMLKPTDDAYEAIWCGWGFGPDFTQQQMIEAIPVVKDLGFKVVTVDAGWFYYNGDYVPRDDTFPKGDAGMKNFVKTFHDNDLKIKLWITTCVAGEQLAREHPEWLVKNKDNQTVAYTFMRTQSTPYLCPALPEVQNYYRELVKKFICEWGYDGFKIDQELINGVPECYAEEHNHKYPEESFEALQEIDKVIYEETVKLKPDAVFEVCPCGMFPSYYKMPYYNQPVSSDFNTPWQIRHRGKTIKALMGSHAAYYGDHVERRYTPNNYPSMMGVGGIPGTMFVLREEDNADFLSVKYPGYLSDERKDYISKWLKIYNDYYLSKGEYLNLYDIVYDKPEAHVIKKDNVMYYAFYAENWNGEIQFKGLDANTNYIIEDYVSQREIGKIKGSAKLNVEFKDYLLVKALPQ